MTFRGTHSGSLRESEESLTPSSTLPHEGEEGGPFPTHTAPVQGAGRLHGHEALWRGGRRPQGPLASVYLWFSLATPGPHRSALRRFSSLRGGDGRGRAWASEGPGVHPFSRQNKPGAASWSQHRKLILAAFQQHDVFISHIFTVDHMDGFLGEKPRTLALATLSSLVTSKFCLVRARTYLFRVHSLSSVSTGQCLSSDFSLRIPEIQLLTYF